MKALVTGGAGLVGSTLCEKLLDRGAAVFCVDNLSLGTMRHLEKCQSKRGFTFEQIDVSQRDWHQKLKLNRESQFDVCIHLAANSDISLGNTNPEMDMQRTYQTTFETLLAVKACTIPQFIFSSTSAVYGADPKFPTPESTGDMHPVSVYGAGKLASENFISAFVENYGLNAWVYRFGNVVGRRLTHGVIFDFVKKLKLDPTKLTVLGNGRQSKTYIDVEDCVEGILWGFEKSAPGKTHGTKFQVFNLSTDGATSVKEIAEETNRIVAKGQAHIEYGTSSVGWVGDVAKTSLDVSKISRLGWVPQKNSLQSVQDSIREYYGWFQNS